MFECFCITRRSLRMKNMVWFWLLILGASAAAQDVTLKLPYTRFELPNGLKVILHEDHSTPMVTVNVWYHVGSSYEKKGRTGFAHLFEHLMFEGSKNVREGDYDNLLEAVGGNNNGSTTEDRTNYYVTVPKNALDLALFLESDRMGFLADAMSSSKVDGQRDVVKNERRQSYENRPYGLSEETILKHFYPTDHPYFWPVIGSMEDLSAASYDDVVEFCKNYYIPNNATLVIAGDIDSKETRKKVEYWFSDVKPGNKGKSPKAAAFELSGNLCETLEDNVQLPRIYIAYKTPGRFQPGDAEMDVLANVLTKGKNSRLYKRLVYDLQIAQDVTAYQESGSLGSKFMIIATARPGHNLEEIKKIIDEEISKIHTGGITQRELQRVINQYEAQYLSAFQFILYKADMMNLYETFTGNPDWANEDMARYKALDTQDIKAMAVSYLDADKRLILSIVPKGKTDLAVKQ